MRLIKALGGVLCLCLLLSYVVFRHTEQIYTHIAPAASTAVSLETANREATATNASSAISTQNKDKVVFVHFLSYQRTGSTFIAKMFSDPNSMFYVYEPLDPLYSAMYGAPDGWTVPDDILNHPNGTIRQIPADELQAIKWSMEKIFNCDMAGLPPAMLAHRFWEQFIRDTSHAAGYVQCLTKNKIDKRKALEKCRIHIQSVCGKRFNGDARRDNLCKTYLWGTENDTTKPDFVPKSVYHRVARPEDDKLPTHFRDYFRCLGKIDGTLRQCAVEQFDKPCREKNMRVIKTVRANMQSAELLLVSNPNYYLIHSYRDPRGAVRSRLESKWSQGIYCNGKADRIAQVYCNEIGADVVRLAEMQKHNYSSRMKAFVYDDFVKEPLLNVLDTYHFLHVEPSEKTKSKFYANRQAPVSKQSETISKKWEKGLSKEQISQIENKCANVFEAMGTKL